MAQFINVSESSLKSWCDQGLLTAVRTAGGHRRLALDDLFQFLRQSGQQLVLPELLGLPSNTGQTAVVVVSERAREQVRDALIAGDEDHCRRIVFDLYLAGQSACEICDHVLALAIHDSGDRWECGQVSIYRERRDCEIGFKILHELRMVVRTPQRVAPVAVGGTLSCDPLSTSERNERACPARTGLASNHPRYELTRGHDRRGGSRQPSRVTLAYYLLHRIRSIFLSGLCAASQSSDRKRRGCRGWWASPDPRDQTADGVFCLLRHAAALRDVCGFADIHRSRTKLGEELPLDEFQVGITGELNFSATDPEPQRWLTFGGNDGWISRHMLSKRRTPPICVFWRML